MESSLYKNKLTKFKGVNASKLKESELDEFFQLDDKINLNKQNLNFNKIENSSITISKRSIASQNQHHFKTHEKHKKRMYSTGLVTYPKAIPYSIANNEDLFPVVDPEGEFNVEDNKEDELPLHSTSSNLDENKVGQLPLHSTSSNLDGNKGEQLPLHSSSSNREESKGEQIGLHSTNSIGNHQTGTSNDKISSNQKTSNKETDKNDRNENSDNAFHEYLDNDFQTLHHGKAQDSFHNGHENHGQLHKLNEEEQQYEDDHKDDNEVENKHKNNDDEAYDDKDAESYNNNKFHHIKVKLHAR